MKKLLCIALALSCFAASALAEPDKGTKDKARAHFRQGVTLVKEGAYQAALVELKRAYELSPDYRVLFNIAQTQLQLGDYVAAIESFESYLREGADQVDAERRTSVEQDLAELRKRVATLEIESNVPGVTVAIDGVRVGETPLERALSVSIGRHQITGTSPDGRVTSQEVELAGGDTRTVELALQVASSAAPARTSEPALGGSEKDGLSRKQRAAIAMLASGGALGVGALVTGLLAKGAHDDHARELNEPRGDAVAIQQSGDDMKRYALTTDILAAGAVAFAITGVVLALTSGGDDDEAELKVGIGPARLTLQGRF
jgi:tetratricopeptide (TPR) repeat protein